MQATERAMRDGVWRGVVWGGAALLLALPWVAMRWTREVQWSAFDFAVFGAMLLAACAAWELALRLSASWRYRLAAALALGIGFLSVWIALAVGIIGDPGDPADAMFALVLLGALAGALRVRGRAAGLARVMRWAALAQVAAGAIGWMLGAPETLAMSVVFASGWLGAAWLFRGAGTDAVRVTH